jgi:hypothetical protein
MTLPVLGCGRDEKKLPTRNAYFPLSASLTVSLRPPMAL